MMGGQVWSLCVNNDETFLSRHRTLNYWAVGVSSLLTQREVDCADSGRVNPSRVRLDMEQKEDQEPTHDG
jgi:hypothetical protein